MGNERAAVWFALSAVPGVGGKTLARLALALHHQDLDVTELRRSSGAAFRSLGLSEKQALAAEAALAVDELPEVVDSSILVPGDPRFPVHRLSDSPPLPVLLRYRGEPSLLTEPSVAFSGSRNASPAALEFVRALTVLLVAGGATIVSGNAKGVDACAHQASIDAGGHTVAVLAEGLASFSSSWVDESGVSSLGISQFEDRAVWRSHQAMSRNETIAALSDVVVVAAAGESGGSLAMGRLCLKSGRPIAVPEADAADSAGNEVLIKEGATRLPFGDVEAAVSIVRSLMAARSPSPPAGNAQKSLFE